MKLERAQPDPGTVVSVAHGAVNGAIKVDIRGGTVVTSSITEEAIADLALAPADEVTVVIKSSDVLIGKR